MTLDRKWISQRFALQGGSPRSIVCGDHDLNPGINLKEPAVPAAVLIPLIDREEGLMLLFTRRTEHLAVHAGQISFPGGHVNVDDANSEETALRECEEETGIKRRHVEVLGSLNDYRTRTGFQVTPVVALVEPNFHLNPDPKEVAAVFEGPLAFFLDPANYCLCRREIEGVERKYHAIPYGDYYIWGATAGILMILYERLGSP